LEREGLIERRERAGSFVVENAAKLNKIALIAPSANQKRTALQEYLKGCMDRAQELEIEVALHHQFPPCVSSVDKRDLSSSQGLISIGRPEYEVFRSAKMHNCPIVVLGTPAPPGEFIVLEDSLQCTRDLAGAMIEDGLRRIGFAGNLSKPTHRLARDGYLIATESLGFGHRLVRDADEMNIGLITQELLEESLDGLMIAGGTLPIAAVPFVIAQAPHVKVGCLRDNSTVAQLADTCYFGEYFQEEAGRLAVNFLLDLYYSRATEPETRYASYGILRPVV
jgi:DNA-binding LacI/PurR family transcriptional regulator